MIYKKHLSNPWFKYIKDGIKKYEGRLNKGDFAKMKIDDIIIFHNEDKGIHKEYQVKITDIYYFNSFNEMITKLRLKYVLPGVNKISNGVNIYHQFYKPEDENKYGVVAIKMNVINKSK